MSATTLVLALALAPSQAEKEVTGAEKKAFLELLAGLPTKGEFHTDEAVQKAAPYTRVLLALTPKDIEKHDIYPFLALSCGLLDLKGPREYAVKNFGKIAHPEIKLAWGVGLFHAKAASREVVAFLSSALESTEQAKLLAEMLGPDFEDFKKRLKESTIKEK
jgi:hypothetical protein